MTAIVSNGIAPLRHAERARWEELWTSYQRFYGVQLSAAVTDATWARLRDGRIQGLGARDAGDRLIGIVHFLYHEDTWSTASACYLQDLYVDTAARGAGVAKRLIAATAEAARQAGANPPYWLTHESNATARRLYDRVGVNHGFLHYSLRPC
jgi:GNAT superfamily N-acetyltransferase